MCPVVFRFCSSVTERATFVPGHHVPIRDMVQKIL